jgi:hypothetical protein
VTFLILFDWQLLPLAAHVKELQNVIKHRVQRNFQSGAPTSRS